MESLWEHKETMLLMIVVPDCELTSPAAVNKTYTRQGQTLLHRYKPGKN